MSRTHMAMVTNGRRRSACGIGHTHTTLDSQLVTCPHCRKTSTYGLAALIHAQSAQARQRGSPISEAAS